MEICLLWSAYLSRDTGNSIHKMAVSQIWSPSWFEWRRSCESCLHLFVSPPHLVIVQPGFWSQRSLKNIALLRRFLPMSTDPYWPKGGDRRTLFCPCSLGKIATVSLNEISGSSPNEVCPIQGSIIRPVFLTLTARLKGEVITTEYFYSTYDKIIQYME